MGKIVIAELDIDVDALIKSTSEVKRVMDSVTLSQKELVKNGQSSSKQYVENASALKNLSTEYQAGIKAIAQTTQATIDAENRTNLMSLALNKESSSIAEARAQNTLLNKLRNEANVTTDEGKKELTALNKKLDENNEFIKENADAYLKQKINIGNYSDSIKDALSNLNPLNGGMAGFVQRSQQAGGVGNLLTTSLKGVATGFFGLVKASLAFIATPVGAILTAIVLVITALVSVFKKLDPVMDKIEQLTSGLGGALDKATVIIYNMITGIKSLGDVFTKLGNFIAHPIDSIKEFTKEVKNAGVAAAQLKEREQELGDLTEIYDVRNKKIQAEIDIDKARLRQRGLTGKELQEIEKRINDNFEMMSKNKGEINTKTTELYLDIAKETAIKLNDIDKKRLEESIRLGDIEVANKLMNDGLITKEAYENLKLSTNAVVESKIEQAKQEEATQIKLENARVKAEAQEQKRREAQAKAVDEQIKKQQTAIDLFIAQQGFKKKSAEDELNLAQEISQKEIALLKFELKAKKISRDEYDLGVTQSKMTLGETTAKIAIENANRELEIFKEANQQRIDEDKFLTDEIVSNELSRIQSIQEAENENAKIRLENGITNQIEYESEIAKIKAESVKASDDIINQKIASDLEQQAIDQENKIALMDSEFEQRQADLDRAFQQELDAAEKTGADKKLIAEKYAKFQKELDTNLLNFKLSSYTQTFSMLKGLFGEQTALGKAAAIAEVGITTYQKAFESFAQAKVFFSNPTTVPLGVNAAIQGGLTIASGLATSAKISGVKFAGGGFAEIDGASHNAGGVPIYAGNKYVGEAQGQEGIAIMNKGAFSQFKAFNYTYGDGDVSKPNFYAGGSIITQGVNGFSSSLGANDIVEIIKNIPAPIVAVEDILQSTNEKINIIQKADY